MSSTNSRKMHRQQQQLPTLPQDVLHNILSRLPVKSLMRFRSVSKSVDSLVHDPHFVTLHLNMNNTSKSRVFVSTDPPQIITPDEENNSMTMPVEYPSLLTADDIEIIGSCHGLLCFMVADAFTVDAIDYKFILWNPSTRAFRELAKPGPLLGNYPDIIPIYGFGYDQASGDYKIIRAVSPCPGTTSIDLEIYTLKDNVWRKKRASLPCILTAEYWRKIEPWFPGTFSRGAGVHANGAVHWLEKIDRSDLILSFDLGKEEFEEVIPLLEYDKDDSNLSELGILGGNLSVLVTKWKTSEIEIWVMEEYGMKGSWTKIATMPDDPGPAFVDSFQDDWFVPFLFCANGCLLVDMDGSEVLKYDGQTKTFSKIELGDNERMFLVQEFVESLVSPYAYACNKQFE